MQIPRRSLLVLALEGAYADVWPRLARESGLHLLHAASVDAFRDADRAVGIVAVDGDAARLGSVFTELECSSVAVAAVASTADHRAAVALCRAGAADVFVLDRDHSLLQEWLASPAIGSTTPGVRLERLETIIRRTVSRTVDVCGGNKSDAARRLGISRTRLQRLLRAEPRNRSSDLLADRADD